MATGLATCRLQRLWIYASSAPTLFARHSEAVPAEMIRFHPVPHRNHAGTNIQTSAGLPRAQAVGEVGVWILDIVIACGAAAEGKCQTVDSLEGHSPAGPRGRSKATDLRLLQPAASRNR